MRPLMRFLAILFLLLIFCKNQPTQSPSSLPDNREQTNAFFKFQIPPEIQHLVCSALAQVTAPDMDTLKTALNVTETYVEGVIENIPVGRNRFFEIFVYDRNSTLTYYGSKYSDISVGKAVQVEIILRRASDTGTAVIIGYFENQDKGKIVYSTFDFQTPYDDGEIFMADPDGMNILQLTNNPGADYHPQISPLGDKIVFVRNLEPYGFNTHIFIMNIDGTGQTQITSGPVREDGPWFSPDGNRIVFRKTTENGPSDLCIINNDGSGFTNITQGQITALFPVWANDGYIYFVTHGDERKIRKVRPDGSDSTVVSPFQIGAEARIHFTSDMGTIFYDSDGYPNQIMKSDFPSFENPTPITSGDDTGGFCLSPDNSKLLYSQGSYAAGYYLYIKDLSTGQVTGLGIRAIHTDWKVISR